MTTSCPPARTSIAENLRQYEQDFWLSLTTTCPSPKFCGQETPVTRFQDIKQSLTITCPACNSYFGNTSIFRLATESGQGLENSSHDAVTIENDMIICSCLSQVCLIRRTRTYVWYRRQKNKQTYTEIWLMPAYFEKLIKLYLEPALVSHTANPDLQLWFWPFQIVIFAPVLCP